jgi:rhodanese-related sulfurtransferase
MKLVSVEQLKARIDNGENIHLVDVREPHEHADFNIGGTLHPLGQIQAMNVEPIEDLKDEEVVVYCRSGSRSGQAGLMLETMGYKNVANLVGGMLEWQDKFGNAKPGHQ